MNTEPKFQSWAVVELFGHARISGLCTEQNVAGTNMLRIDVPQTKAQPAFTRLLGSGAIYAINPVTEEVARAIAEQLHVAPIQPWDIRKFADQLKLGPVRDVEQEEMDDLLNPNN